MKKAVIFVFSICFILLHAQGKIIRHSSLTQNNNFQIAGYKKVHTLTDKSGKFLGDVFIKELKPGIFNSLVIAKVSNGRVDTLYSIHRLKMKYPKGIDLTVGDDGFYGYKFLIKKSQYIEMEMCDKNGHSYSD